MIPLRRCGSHALRLRLNLNPCFYSPYPLHIVDFMPLVPLYGDLLDDRAYFRLVVDVSRSDEARRISGLSALWSSNAFAPIPANADKFRVSLTVPEIEVIETVTAPHMARYGYPLMTGACAPAPALDVETARQRSDRARAAAWADLERRDYRDHTLRGHRAAYIASVRGGLA